MDGQQLAVAIVTAFDGMTEACDELRDLDQALGDGDLGITVAAGAAAVHDALSGLDEGALPADVIRTCAKAFANANPSTMAALVAGALLAGARTFDDLERVDVDDAADFATSAAESIATRGKAEPGDKTILDALLPVADALRAEHADPRAAAASAAAEGVTSTIDMQSRRGRAAWLQERSIGHQDPGATALLRFLEAWPA